MLLRRRSDRLEALRQVPMFCDLNKRQLTEVDRVLLPVERAAGSVLVKEGYRMGEFVLIIEGSVIVSKKGREIARLGEGEFFGEMSVLDHQPGVATVTAATAVSLLVIDGRDFRAVLDKVPGLQRKILVTLCGRLRKADEALAV